ncbi:hypothetical protein Bpfe_025553, partial [Biomphalaria pfeifferi]
RCTVGCSSSREALTLEEEFMVKQMRSWGFSSPDHRALKENQRIIDLKFKLARLVDTITDELEKKKREQEARAKEAEMKRRYEQCRGSWFIRACLERGTNIRVSLMYQLQKRPDVIREGAKGELISGTPFKVSFSFISYPFFNKVARMHTCVHSKNKAFVFS